MAKLIFHKDKIKDLESFKKLCPFGAIIEENGNIVPGSACKMCNLCVKKGPEGAAVLIEEEIKGVDKSLWNGIAVYVGHTDGDIHPVYIYKLPGSGPLLICLFAWRNLHIQNGRYLNL